MDSTTRSEVAEMLSPGFGEQVVSAYRGGRLLRATGPRTRTLFAVLSSVLLSALALLTFGRVEMVAVGRGAVQESGRSVEVVSLVAEADRGSMVPGLAAHVEVEQFALGARVTAVSAARVSPAEVAELLGEEGAMKGPVYRVELTLTDDEELARARRFIRPGMLVNTRYTLRTERPITIIFEPLRRWLH